MARCVANRQDGQPCKVEALADSAYCYAHDPARADARQAHARKGGRAGGVGRPGGAGELAEIRELLKDLIAQAQDGSLEAGRVWAVNALLNTRLRLLEVERKLRESDELEERLAALEAAGGPAPYRRYQ